MENTCRSDMLILSKICNNVHVWEILDNNEQLLAPMHRANEVIRHLRTIQKRLVLRPWQSFLHVEWGQHLVSAFVEVILLRIAVLFALNLLYRPSSRGILGICYFARLGFFSGQQSRISEHDSKVKLSAWFSIGWIRQVRVVKTWTQKAEVAPFRRCFGNAQRLRWLLSQLATKVSGYHVNIA